MDGHPFPNAGPALLRDGTKRSRKPATQRGGGDEVHAVRQRNEIQVGVVDQQSLRESAAMGESRLRLPFTDLLIASGAPLAGAAAKDKRCGYPFTTTPPDDILTDPDHDPGPLVPGNLGGTISGSCRCQPCQSLRHSPAALTSMIAPCGGRPGSGASTTLSGPPNSSYCTAFTPAHLCLTRFAE